MLVRDIDKKIDMDVKLPVYIFRSHDNTTWMSVHFPKNAKNPRI
jgi:hypothetical protein